MSSMSSGFPPFVQLVVGLIKDLGVNNIGKCISCIIPGFNKKDGDGDRSYVLLEVVILQINVFSLGPHMKIFCGFNGAIFLFIHRPEYLTPIKSLSQSYCSNQS